MAIPVPQLLLAPRPCRYGRHRGSRLALWDIKGKVAGLPVYQLLGGASRTGLRTYGRASGRDIPELFGSIRQHLEEGYKSIRAQTSVPGIKALYGVAAQAQATGERYDFEPAGRASSRPRKTGIPGPICATYPPSLKRSVTSSAPSCRCCTTATTV